jgi:dCMP deaminase
MFFVDNVHISEKRTLNPQPTISHMRIQNYFPLTSTALHLPGNECAKMIAQSRIKEVIYMQDEEHDADIYRASRIMLHMAGVQTRQYNPTTCSVVLDLGSQDDDEVNDSVYATTLPVAKKESKQEEQRDQELRKLLLEEANWNPTAATNHKRKGYLSWDDYFMAMAFLTARRSKDPNTQVGACIVSPDKLILALGYNGFPRGCSDDYLPWARSNDQMLHKKYAYVCHAEVNAILNKGSSNVKDSTLYVALFPCNECAKMIIQAGIKEVVYLQDHYHDTDMCRASRIMFGMAGVVLRRHAPAVSSIGIEFMLTNATETGCTVIQDDATVQEEKKADDGDA